MNGNPSWNEVSWRVQETLTILIDYTRWGSSGIAVNPSVNSGISYG